MTEIRPAAIPATHNLAELTVSELSAAIKRTLESGFERVRVRGEISGFKRAGSGHLYLQLKDEPACIKAVCWRSTALRSPSPGTRSMTSITRWKRSRSLSITMSNGVVVVPSSL